MLKYVFIFHMFQINPCLFWVYSQRWWNYSLQLIIIIIVQVFCLVNRPELPVIIDFNFEQWLKNLNTFTYSSQVFNIQILLLNTLLIQLYILLYINHAAMIFIAKFRCNLWPFFLSNVLFWVMVDASCPTFYLTM